MDPNERIARHVFVSGRVQGVAFRHHTKVAARSAGLAGWVRNLADGRVEAWLEGPPADVERVLAWLRRGPPAASVEHVEVHTVERAGLDGFAVRYDVQVDGL
jgi:acylphosphatase